MTRLFLPALLLLGLIAAPLPPVARAQQPGLAVANDHAALEFPERLTFSVDLQSEADITRVVLEYGVEQLTCGSVVAKAFPDITPGKQVTAAWTWEMKQSGSQPPGARIWWRWRITDATGAEALTEQQTVTWLDDVHAWQAVTGGQINLHWYEGSSSFGRQLHDSAVRSLANLARTTGLQPDAPVDLYIYSGVEELRAAVLYEPGWTGGLAYSANDVVIIGIAPNDLAWGKRTEAHELTHVLVGHLTFSCLSDVPTWLNEGLAVYGEGGPDQASLQQFQAAVKADALLPVRALSGGFSEDPAKADLSYSQSYSLTKFLIDKYGRDKMLDLLRQLRDGVTVDQALVAVYGFDIDGFEDAWRDAVGAQPRANAGAAPTPTLVPTLVPTIAPIAGVPVGPSGAVAVDQGGSAANPAAPPSAAAPGSTSGWMLTGALVFLGVILLAGVITVGVALTLMARESRNK